MKGPVLPGQQLTPGLDLFYPTLRGLATLFVAFLGMLLAGMIGSLAYPGGGAIIGSFLGFVAFCLMGCCSTGFYRDFNIMPSNIPQILPHSMAVKVGSHGAFDIIVTVHEAIGVDVQGRLPWTSADTYIEITCGGNPMKRTCVRKDGKFNEQFKLQITGADDMVLFRLKDQDVFGSRNIGYVVADIQKDIIGEGFPWQKRYAIQAGQNDRLIFSAQKAELVLSFDCTGDYPPGLREGIAQRTGARQDLEQQWSGQSYGAVSYLSQLEFNTHMQMNNERSGA